MLEKEIDDLLNELLKISSTHPNIANLWKQNIIIKKERLEGAIIQCKQSLPILLHSHDITNEQLENMSFIYSNIVTNT